MIAGLVLDFETSSGADLKQVGAWKYAENPTTEVISCGFGRSSGDRFLWVPGVKLFRDEILKAIRDGEIFVCFQAFEKAIWRRIMVPLYGFPDIPNSQWHDIAARCAQLAIPFDLDGALEALKAPFKKDKEGNKLVKLISKTDRKGNYNVTPEMIDRVRQYNMNDIDGEVYLHERLGWMPASERNVWLLDERINERGVRLDLPYVRAARQVVEKASIPLIKEFQQITGIAKLKSPKLLKWTNDHGVHLPNLQKETVAKALGIEDEAETHDDWEDYIILPNEVERALEIRHLIGSSSVTKLPRMEDCVCADGRARGIRQYHGTGPGRSTGRLFQPQNFPRGLVSKWTKADPPKPEIVVDAIMSGDPSYVECIIGAPPIPVVVQGLRHAIIPNPDRYFVSGDLAGIQARLVLAVAGQHDKTALMASGADVYCDMASDIYKRPITKSDKEERQVGKNSVLGLGFQMGAPKFHWKYCPLQPLEFAQNVVQTYRREWAPLVPKVWYGLEGAAARTVHTGQPHEAFGIEYRREDMWLSARLPSGRKIWYFNPVGFRKAMPWDETDVRLAWRYQMRKQGRLQWVDAFGGLLTENVIMGMEVDLLWCAIAKCEAEKLPVVLEVYDEIVAEPERTRQDAKTVLQQIMEDSPPWARAIQVPIQIDSWTGDRYKK